MDSGLAWHCARKNYEGMRIIKMIRHNVSDTNPSKTADVILEGVDQSRGWFSSLALTGVALNVSQRKC